MSGKEWEKLIQRQNIKSIIRGHFYFQNSNMWRKKNITGKKYFLK